MKTNYLNLSFRDIDLEGRSGGGIKQEIIEVDGYYPFLSKCKILIDKGYFIDSIIEKQDDWKNSSKYVIIAHKLN